MILEILKALQGKLIQAFFVYGGDRHGNLPDRLFCCPGRDNDLFQHPVFGEMGVFSAKVFFHLFF